MVGRQVILINKPLDLQELYQIMAQRWNKDEYNDFFIGKPTKYSVEQYILLPASSRFMVIAFPRKAGSFFSRKNKVVLSVCENSEGVQARLLSAIPTQSLFFGVWQLSKNISVEKERKGPAEDALQKYTEYMRSILTNEGLTT